MGQDLRLSCRIGFQTLIEVRQQIHGVELHYRTLNYETIRVFYMSRRTVRPVRPSIRLSLLLPPIHTPICLSAISLFTFHTLYIHTADSPPARQCTTPTFCTRFPQPPKAVPISSHRRYAAPYPIVAAAKLFAVHSWQSAPETGNSFTGWIPSDMRVSVGPVKRHDTLHHVNVFPGQRSFKQARVCRFVVLSTPTGKQTSVRYTAESGCYKWQHFSRYCRVNLSWVKSHTPR